MIQRKMIEGINPLRPRKIQIEANTYHSKNLRMVMMTTQMMIPMMKIGRVTGTNGGRKVKKRSHKLAAKTVLSLAMRTKLTSKGKSKSFEQ